MARDSSLRYLGLRNTFCFYYPLARAPRRAGQSYRSASRSVSRSVSTSISPHPMRTATGIMLPLQREEFAQDAADQAGKLLTPEKLKSNVLPRGPACSAWRWTPAAEGERLRQDARRVHPRGREHARARVRVPAGLRDSSGARPVSPVPGVITAPLHVQHFTGEDASSPLLQVNRQAPVPLPILPSFLVLAGACPSVFAGSNMGVY